MPVADGCTDRRTGIQMYGGDQIYRTPVGSAGGPKIITFLPNVIPGNEKLPCLSNPIPYPEYLYLSISIFLINVTAPNKQFSNVG